MIPTNPTRASAAPDFASAYEMASVADWESKTETTTMRCDSSAWSIAVGRPFFPTTGSFAAWTTVWTGARWVGAAAFAFAAVVAL